MQPEAKRKDPTIPDVSKIKDACGRNGKLEVHTEDSCWDPLYWPDTPADSFALYLLNTLLQIQGTDIMA